MGKQCSFVPRVFGWLFGFAVNQSVSQYYYALFLHKVVFSKKIELVYTVTKLIFSLCGLALTHISLANVGINR